MAMNRTAVILISSLVMGHLGYYVLKPMFIPPSSNPTSVPEKPVYWQKDSTQLDQQKPS